ncbi:hypothetical protein DNL40_09815 [Xylanimonas oleitrophica]|uniref:Maltokinase N-terminal cap domain-containing protein n=1 Tax=Xylanimonas oleitrophica TaxID=2607479 RepID=A0A2W5WP52_9MICO|nr:hypothetical protein [Xylanimonas oleitrophica]PZR52940.1 hypothetical protein DNL40_09815 [Xylanimonas oleitrophica]
MAILHKATLTPTKLELLESWLPSQPWFPGSSAAGLERVAAYRFDDPDGQVGIETFLVRTPGGPVVQVPLTYRGAPLEGAEASLVGTLEHSVLGRRWVYDAESDPVYVTELTRVIREGGTEVAQYYETPEGPQRKEDATHVRGSGLPGAAAASEVDDAGPVVVRVLDGGATPPPSALTLTGTWEGQPGPVLLAHLG